MTSDSAIYDSIAEEYVQSKQKGVEKYVEEYTCIDVMLKSIRNEHGLLTGKRMLDLACGDGHYTRKLKFYLVAARRMSKYSNILRIDHGLLFEKSLSISVHFWIVRVIVISRFVIIFLLHLLG